MAVYFLTGTLGAGKTLASVGKIRDALKEGRRVCTNLDLYPEKMLARGSRATVVRLPDKPRLCDLQGIGFGCDEKDYTGKRFGLIVLDELGTWFNTRNWSDKERLPVIDWFLHARKYRWDVIFIVQDIEAVDKQLRSALCEHFVRVRRLDRYMVPLLGTVAKWCGGTMPMPQIHAATVYYGERADPVCKVEKWWYRGKELYDAFETGQVFVSGQELVGEQLLDMRAAYTMLSPWHVAGRYSTARQSRWPEIASEAARWGILMPLVVWAIVVCAVTGRRLTDVMVEAGLASRRKDALG